MSEKFVDDRDFDEFASRVTDELGKPSRIQHLYDIFEGEKMDIEGYYGEDNESFSNPQRWAIQLSNKHKEETKKFINRLSSSEFSYGKLSRNSVEDFLVEEGGMDRQFLDIQSIGWKELLLIFYHSFYHSHRQDFDVRYERLIAKSTVYKETDESIYEYTSIDLEDIDERVEQYERKYNRDRKNRNLKIKVYDFEDNTSLKFYKEAARVSKPVFEEREETISPKMTYESFYPIKTITVSISKSDKTQVKFSKSTSGWKRLLSDFFEVVFNKDEALDEENRTQNRKTEEVIETAIKNSNKEQTTDIEIIEEIESELQTQIQEEIESMDDEEKEEYEGLEQTIEIRGIEITDSDITQTEKFKLTAQSPINLRDWKEQNREATQGVKELLRAANEKDISFIFKGELLEQGVQEFIVEEDTWRKNSGGLPEEAIEVLKKVL